MIVGHFIITGVFFYGGGCEMMDDEGAGGGWMLLFVDTFLYGEGREIVGG